MSAETTRAARSVRGTKLDSEIWGKHVRVVHWGALSARVHTRVLAITAALALLCVMASVWSMTIGDTSLSLGQIWDAILGDASEATQRIVVEWRMPRMLLGLLGGAALGLSGAIFQSITRNPLGSPDVIGFSSGAYTGALIGMLIVGTSSGPMGTIGALIGGLVTALVVYLLAYRRGVQGMRLIVVGIAVAAMLNAFNSYMLIVAGREAAVSAAAWGAGSLNNATWTGVRLLLISLVVLIPVLVTQVRPLRMLELGDDQSSSLGIAAERTRLTLLVIGVGFVAVITALTGPISFVALAAPQLARRITGAAGVALLPAALMGGLLLVVSDVLARVLVAPSQLPVGVVTSCLGGTYLLWLLIRQSRKR